MMLGWATSNFLMEYIEDRVKDEGAWTKDHTLENVDAMYQVVASTFGGTGTNRNARATHARSWSTFVNQIKMMRQREREAAEVLAVAEAVADSVTIWTPDQKKRLSY
jgi:hypothetical protein